jgi:alanyl aminopeptidase
VAAPAPARAPAAAATSGAQPVFRLPRDVRPTRQRVELEVVPDREDFSGRVEIALQLDAPRDDLWVSAVQLDLSAGTLESGGESLPLTVEAHDDRGAARLILPRRVGPGPATLRLSFRGAFNPLLVGLYRVKARDRWAAYTQFEAADARRAFPCFDEPSFKIPWEVVLTVPKELVAVSNAPVAEESAAGPLKRIRFEPMRPLPTYLIALAVGDFDVVTRPPLPPNSIRKRPLQMRGIATKGRGRELAHALDAAGEILVMLERWFGTEFPYQKLDHIAVPDFQYGAMENAGLITYRESLLLVEPKTASEEQKMNVGVVVAHEMSHQWYGDLVTMAWWDDFWLNESFASVMELFMVVPWSPDSRFDLVKLQEVHAAMATDELSSVTPIRRDVQAESEIFGFDYLIAYEKGSWVVAMFEKFLGAEAFRAGLKQYLAKHADGNATRDDLMAALSAAGGTEIGPAMRSFIDQPGIPLVRAELHCDGGRPRVALTQSRNLPLGSTAPRSALWSVPVCVRSDGGRAPDCMLLDAERGELALARKTCPAWIAPNPDGQGYYRWMLPPEQLRDLLGRGLAHLTPAERLSLASNLRAGFRSGILPAADVLAALAPLAADREPVVAREPGEMLVAVRDEVIGPERRGEVEAAMRALYRPVLARLGWRSRRSESSRVQMFRPWVVQHLALVARDPAVLDRAAGLGRAYLGTDGQLHPEALDRNLVGVAVRAAALRGSAELFDLMLERLWKADDFTVRANLLAGLGQFTDPALAERARALAFDDRLRVNERASVLEVQAETEETRRAAWEWVKKNFDSFAARLPPSYVRFLPSVQRGCSEAEAVDLESFGPRVRSHPGGAYNLAKMVEKTRLCAAQAAGQRDSASAYFAAAPRAGGSSASVP